ncbi:MAG: PEP-CTERM sorting domain-containing protein [Hydrogenophilales bacterium 28-61-23]|nr:MAG: PEP-CTERM sorting domain-containing protein [Hydrogenophilales bacterium 28-61-23]
MHKTSLLGSILFAAVATMAGSNAQAAVTSINLGNYAVQNTYALDLNAGLVSGLEASAVTYARDRNSLFYVGDEGTGVVEISKTGTTLGSMTFDWANTGSSKHDTEGLTYLGGGVLVVSEERLYDAYRFSYSNGGSATLANSFVSISNANVGNNGLEGISYDARGAGSFVTVKQVAAEDILAGSLTFASGAGGTSTMAQLFNPALMGVASLSDVQTLSSVDALVGTAAADNLLVLSLDSRKLIEVNRAGTVLSSFDLSNVLPNNGIEGVTVDEKGTIYLVAEQIQDGTPNTKSQLIVLAAPVPEADTYALMLAGMGLVGLLARRRKLA